jgi:selT/selW/selH-like putative selenoprotein
MKIVIEFCEPCGYRPRAQAAGARLRERAGTEVDLVRGTGGVFEITVDGALKFSKKATGRFPTDAEIDALAKG